MYLNLNVNGISTFCFYLNIALKLNSYVLEEYKGLPTSSSNFGKWLKPYKTCIYMQVSSLWDDCRLEGGLKYKFHNFVVKKGEPRISSCGKLEAVKSIYILE